MMINMYELILKKRRGGSLQDFEMKAMISNYLEAKIPEYQMAAMLMAIFFQGMSDEETYHFTQALAQSGDFIDLSGIPGQKVDKHSSGGVGDKTSLIVVPLLAACGFKVAKMSGRGLGHTGGTIDKLCSIPGLKTKFRQEEFIELVKQQGLAIVEQSQNLAPGDKKLYALRDVTATVDCIPLIAASIMSKKIAAGDDYILLDVKVGAGAFMKTLPEAILLAKTMVAIGEKAGKETVALITNMEAPLGLYIGNNLEVIEAIEVLQGKGAKDITTLSLEIVALLLELATEKTTAEALALATEQLQNGQGLDFLKKMIKAQGGDVTYIENPEKFKKAKFKEEIIAQETGYLSVFQTEEIGLIAMQLGAGRETLEEEIMPEAGIKMLKKIGDHVEKGEVVMILLTAEQRRLDATRKRAQNSFKIRSERPEPEPLIYAKVSQDKVEIYEKERKK